MKALASLGVMSALVLSASPALAASGPSGKYAFVVSEICEAKLTVVKNGMGQVTDVNLTQPGLMYGGTGFITFTPSSASAGHATITGAIAVEGGALRVGSNGNTWTQGAKNLASTPYSFTATTFTLGTKVYQWVNSNLAGTVAKNVYLLLHDTTTGGWPDCVSTISATKQ